MVEQLAQRLGLRERKRRQTRQAIAEAAMRLFAERGFDAVTVAEIAEEAGVAKVTLFKYFPTKESLVLEAPSDDPARIVAAREPGQSALAALRSYYRAFAADPGIDSPEELIARMRVIAASPALTASLHRSLDRQRDALAETLAGEPGAPPGDLIPYLVAAQISGAIITLKSGFFRRLAVGIPVADAVARLAADVEAAFDLLEQGIGDRYTR
jgi:AcrR family transcriptional regulator